MADASTVIGNLDYFQIIQNILGISLALAAVLVFVIAIWTLVWKGLALWKSARKSHMIWFIVLLIVNTIGILDILYIYIFSKWGEKREARPVKKQPAKKKR